MEPVSSFELFIVSPQQKVGFSDKRQAGIFEGDPNMIWPLKPNLDNVVWDFTVVSTNAAHLRSEKSSGSIPAKVPGTIRIVCLGDSVTFGYRVPLVFPERPTNKASLPYPMLVEKQLRAANPGRNIEVINMAVPGYTSHQGRIWLSRDIGRLAPDLVTVSFGWNDASLGDVPDREAIKTDVPSVAVRPLVDRSQVFAHLVLWMRAREAARTPADIPKPFVLPGPRVPQDEYLSNITAILDTIRQYGAKAVVIAAPYRDYSPQALEADRMFQYRTALGAEMRDRGVPYLEIPESIESSYPSNLVYFGARIHPSKVRHRLMAVLLIDLVGSEHLLPDLQMPAAMP